MKWSDEYATGVARIDEQHKLIFKLAEDFREALGEGQGEGVYGGLLESLDLYVRTHFRIEEGVMDRYQCPAAQRNREAHAKFVVILTAFRDRYASRGFDRADANRFADTIERWLTDHICRIDVELRQFVPHEP